MSVDPRAQAGFEVAARTDYERGRPGYPVEIVSWLVSAFGLSPGSRVLDLGAGTGKFTRMLQQRAGTVVALEPVAEMRDALRNEVTGTLAVGAVAEVLPFQDGSFDFVTAAQSFHWFRTDEALAETARVLRPFGPLVMLWNQRESSGAWLDLDRRLTELATRYQLSGMAFQTNAQPPAFLPPGLFEGLQRHSVRHEHEQDLEGLVARIRSSSSVARLAPELTGDFDKELRAVLSAHPLLASGVVAVPYTTEIYWTRRV